MKHANTVSLIKIGPVTVVTFEPVSHADGTAWQEALTQMRALADGAEPVHILLDWQWVQQVTGAVLNDIEEFVKELDAGDGSLRLCGLPEQLRAAFEPALLDRLDLGESVPDALPRYVRELRAESQTAADDSGCRIR